MRQFRFQGALLFSQALIYKAGQELTEIRTYEIVFGNRIKLEQKIKKMSGFASGIRIIMHEKLLLESNRGITI